MKKKTLCIHPLHCTEADHAALLAALVASLTTLGVCAAVWAR